MRLKLALFQLTREPNKGGDCVMEEIRKRWRLWECRARESVSTLRRQKAGSQPVKLIGEQRTEVIEGRPN